jgi:GDSL-like Lipase/Acylhydrolase family
VTRRATVLVGALVVSVAVLVGAGLGELGLRLFYPQPLGVWHHDRSGLAMHWPGRATYLAQFGQTVAFNSRGMRDREHPASKPDGVFRILVLGDSFMEALQVPYERSFPGLLEQELARATGRRVEIINASVSGWGTDDELQYLTRYGAQHADLVLVAVTLHNDISDNLRERFHAIKDGKLVRQPIEDATFWQYKVVELKGFLATHSHGFQLLSRARWSRQMRWEAGQLSAHVAALFRPIPDPNLARGVELTELLLAQMQRVASAQGSRMILVLLPLSVQLSDETFAQLARTATGSETGLDIRMPQRLVMGVADRTRVPAIDLLAGFRARAAEGGRLFLERDGHWNEAGHRLAVELVLREMLARGLAGS